MGRTRTMLAAAAPPNATERHPSGLACLALVARRHGLHLTEAQLVHDNQLASRAVSAAEIVAAAERAGLKARRVTFGPGGEIHLAKVLPAIVRLKTGRFVVLDSLEGSGDALRILLRDPDGDGSAAAVDRLRFEDAWTGEAILIKRDYRAADEDRPFGLPLILGLIFREKWIVRDIAISGVIMGFLALAPIIFWRLMSDKVIFFKATNTFFVLSVAFLILIVFDATFAFLRHYLVVQLTTRVDIRLGTYLFDKLLKLPIDFFERTQVGKVAHDVQQVWKVRNFLLGQLFGTLLDSITLFIFIPVMFFFSPLMTAIVLGLCGLIMAWLIFITPIHRRKASAVEAAEAQRGAFLVQTVNGIRTVKSLALDARQRHLWDVHTAKTARLHLEEGASANMVQSVARPLERLAVTGSFAVGVYIALTTDDPVFIGSLFAFLLLSQRVAAPLLQAAKLITQYDSVRIALGVVARLLNQPPEEGRSEHAVRTPLEGRIEFAGVSFKYAGAPDPALAEVTFAVPAGTTLGVVGRSGSGKTTLTKLLQRLHSDFSGLIKIDGIDVREYDVDHLRRSVGVVLQENFLFSGTIRENIAAARPDATFEEVTRAARLAGAEEFIDRLPRGYETHIYEGSPNLSGGQRQRLAIARALIIDPRILILDEATSALDAESEALVNANIARIAKGRTLVIVSHRLSSLMHADQILVLERGRVDAIGSHDELLASCDIYSNLWHQQTHHIVTAAGRSRVPLKGPARVS